MIIRMSSAMADAAEGAYDTHARHGGFPGCSRSVLEVALKAALQEVTPEDVEGAPITPTTPGTLSRLEALDRATQLVNEMSQPITNARGYADGWKPPTLTERTQAIRELTATLLGEVAERG